MKLCRISQFRILTGLVFFLLRSSSDVAINPDRILIRRFAPDLDGNLIKSWHNPVRILDIAESESW